MRAISERVFWDTYKPIARLGANVESGWLWEIDEVAAAGVPTNRVWTVVDVPGVTNTLYASPGYHVVNKIGYVVTEVPWTDAARDAVYSR